MDIGDLTKAQAVTNQIWNHASEELASTTKNLAYDYYTQIDMLKLDSRDTIRTILSIIPHKEQLQLKI